MNRSAELRFGTNFPHFHEAPGRRPALQLADLAVLAPK